MKKPTHPHAIYIKPTHAHAIYIKPTHAHAIYIKIKAVFLPPLFFAGTPPFSGTSYSNIYISYTKIYSSYTNIYNLIKHDTLE